MLHGSGRELHGGGKTLHDGATELHGGGKTLHDGAMELHDGGKTLHDSATELHDGGKILHDSAMELHDKAEPYLTHFRQLRGKKRIARRQRQPIESPRLLRYYPKVFFEQSVEVHPPIKLRSVLQHVQPDVVIRHNAYSHCLSAAQR